MLIYFYLLSDAMMELYFLWTWLVGAFTELLCRVYESVLCYCWLVRKQRKVFSAVKVTPRVCMFCIPLPSNHWRMQWEKCQPLRLIPLQLVHVRQYHTTTRAVLIPVLVTVSRTIGELRSFEIDPEDVLNRWVNGRHQLLKVMIG